MAAGIQIVIKNDVTVRKHLSSFGKELKDREEPIQKSAQKYVDIIHKNFVSEGKTFGSPWKPLAPATLADKRKLFEQGKSKAIQKPLVRTRALKQGIVPKAFKTVGHILSKEPYFKIHQEGGTANYKGKQVKIPRRIIYKVDWNRRRMVKLVFQTWVKDIAKKHKLI